MPKNNKKRGAQSKGAGAGAGVMGSHPPTDEENSTGGENWSTASVLSDNSSTFELDAGNSGDREDQEAEWNVDQEKFEDCMGDCIEGLTVKSAPKRIKSLQGLREGLCKRYCAEFLQKSKETITDSLLKCLKRGKGEEKTLAVRCLGLLALQLGEELSSLYQDTQATLAAFLADNTAPAHTRGQCATTMGLCCFINSCTGDDDVIELGNQMSLMEAMFQPSSRSKANGALPQADPQLSEVKVNCLDAWCLLLTRAPDHFIQQKARSHISALGDLLLSADTELRIAAGEAIALLFDLNRYIDEDFDESVDQTDVLCDQLKELSTESCKHKKRDAMRHQRARFRDILQTVQDGEVEEEIVKMGSQEMLSLEGWSSKVQYNAFCTALGSGIFPHLQENVIVRDLFDLGSPLAAGSKPGQKMSKIQRKYFNSQAEKARTLSRAKNRDKRSVVPSY